MALEEINLPIEKSTLVNIETIPLITKKPFITKLISSDNKDLYTNRAK
jgi:hypothetical protein